MDSTFYAHSTEREDKEDWQLLNEHLINVGKFGFAKAKHFGFGDFADVAGLLHDLGKYAIEFQKRLEGAASPVNHSTWGAIIAQEKYGSLGTLLAYCIAGHHAGLTNGKETYKRTSLADRLKDNSLPTLEPVWEQEVQLPDTVSFPSSYQFVENAFRFQVAFLTRMLFSCLVDSDFIDTENFYNRIKGESGANREGFPSLAELKEQLEVKLSEFKPDTDVNKIRCEILDSVRKRYEEVPGLFSLNVPTGGGKTLTSMAFALDHAIKHEQRRIIYVIPFTSIIEQNARVFREAFGELGIKAVLEHHSAYSDKPENAPEHLKDPESKEKLKLAMENWEAPIVVTTAVQFFESLFADRSSRCRKLHNIANSVVILDEVQTLPVKLLRPCVAAIDELSRNYNTSLILCTATQPALGLEQGFKHGLQNVRELAPNPDKLHKDLERYRVKHIGKRIDEQIVEELSELNQCLCIVNNRRHARVLYDSLCDLVGEENTYHLTTSMCAKHRSEVLEDIREILAADNPLPCRILSTSLIEAGIDISLPTVYRAEAGLDSIAQAGGRCNRNGERPIEQSELRIFEVGSDWKAPPELSQFAEIAQSVIRKHGDKSLSNIAITEYFQELFWQKGDGQLDAHNILERLEKKGIDDLPFESMAAQFRMIESNMMPVIIPFNEEAEKALDDLCYVEKCGGIAKTLQRYLVQVPEKGFWALQQSGAIAPVAPEKFGEQFMKLVNFDLYDKKSGLNWDNPDFIKAENLAP